MKTRIAASIATLCLAAVVAGSAVTARADNDNMWRGALIGAATGAIVGHNSHDIDTAWAVPVMAATGALIGHYYDRRHHSYDYYNDPYYDRSPYGYRGGYYDAPYYPRGYGYRDGYYRVRREKPIDEQKAAYLQMTAPDKITTSTSGRQPGVQLIKIPIEGPGGVELLVNILHTGGKFVGPQGEEYDGLPTTEALQARYGR
jgi:hypothetical protein